MNARRALVLFCGGLLSFSSLSTWGEGASAATPPMPSLSAGNNAPPPISPEEREGVTVLGYGVIGEEKGALPTAEFWRQMHNLRALGYSPVSLADFLDWKAGRRSLPPRSVLLTFDEVPDDWDSEVWPILQRFGYPFLLFVDGRHLNSEEGCLPLRQLQKLHQAGASIGSHSLRRLPASAWQSVELSGEENSHQLVEREIGDSARRIREAFGSCEAFSYPGGYADVAMLRSMTRYGYRVAFSFLGGEVKRDSPAFMAKRWMIRDAASFARALGSVATPGVAALLPEDDVAEEVEEETLETPGESAESNVEPKGEAEKKVEETPAEKGLAEEPRPREAVLDDELAGMQPTYGRLGRRTPDSDWVTVQFDKPLVPRDKTRVAVLGYHNFSNVRPVSEMRMRTAEFCQQMQYIREAGLTVITMQDFLEWLRGQRRLPERCVLITIDDGWKSAYTDAYPVLRAYGYPFTLFLYTRYIDVHGDSMTSGMIREMMTQGATIGSHSTSHLYPRMWKRYAQDSPEYADQIRREIPASGEKLSSLFGNCSAYCYPGGYNTPPMLAALEASSFQAAFTVLEAKVSCEEPPYLVHRYMVFGNDSRIFRRAVNFDGEAGVKPTREGIAAAEAGARAFFPRAFERLSGQKKAETSRTASPAKKSSPHAHRPLPSSSAAPAPSVLEPSSSVIPAPASPPSGGSPHLGEG